MEILVVDGMSTDGTRDIVTGYTRQHPSVRLLDNARLTTPAGLNVGVQEASGDIIIRVDAHASYPADYVSKLVAWLQRSDADNVGGVVLTRPGSAGAMARAIACALSHPFGVGNSHFRIGAGRPRYVDTVPFGCYRRSVFERVGLFDEELIRNQDDEFNMRLIRAGGRILLVPDIKVEYAARDTLVKVARMTYQYGLFKPLAAAKLGGVFTLRQLVPPAFLAILSALVLGSPWWPALRGGLAGVVGLYLVSNVLAATSTRSPVGITSRSLMCLVFPTLHLSYGLGYLIGAARLLWPRSSRAESHIGVRLTR
jgi:glycosyltransferase involved in cell wall biosynthesis